MLIYFIFRRYYESTSVRAYLCIYFSFALLLMHLSYVNRKPLHTIKARFCQIRSKHCSNSIDRQMWTGSRIMVVGVDQAIVVKCYEELQRSKVVKR